MNLLALTGVALSGKSTAADYLCLRHGFVRVKFAGPLKAMLRAIGLTDAEIEGDLKEHLTPLLAGKTPRHAMQTLGTEWGRKRIGEAFWINLWTESASDVLDQGGRVVVDDCRFPNEVDAVHRLGGKVVRLTGRGGINGGHSSEALEFAPDIILDNSNSMRQLQESLDRIIHG